MTQMNPQVMSRFTRLRPVHSIKHIIDLQGGLTVGTVTSNTLILAKDAPVLAGEIEVETASTISAIFLNIQVAASSTAALANVYMAVSKNPGGNLADIDPQTVGDDDNKKFVIHQEMIMTEKNTTAIPRTLFKGVIRIPRGYKRFGINDKLVVTLKSPGVTMDFCIQCIYKEFR